MVGVDVIVSTKICGLLLFICLSVCRSSLVSWHLSFIYNSSLFCLLAFDLTLEGMLCFSVNFCTACEVGLILK